MEKGKLAVIGLLFLVFIGVCLAMASFFKDWKVLTGTKSALYISFESVEGLGEGDVVRVKGVESGTIEQIDFGEDTASQGHIIVKVKLYKTIGKFWTSYKIRIEESSIIGGKYLSIIPRDPTVTDPERQQLEDPKKGTTPDNPLLGKSEPSGFQAINEWLSKNGGSIDDAFKRLKELLEDLRKGSVGKVMLDEGRLYDDVKKMAGNAADTLESAKKIMEEVNKGKGTLGKLVFEDKLYNELTGLTEKARSLADRMDRGEGTLGKLATDSKLYDDLADVMGAAKDLLNKMRTGEGTVGALLNERELYDEMRETTANLREITGKIAKGGSLAARMVNDEEMGSDAKDTVRNLKEMSDHINHLSEKLDKGEGTIGRMMSDDSLYRKADQAVDSLNKTLGSLSSLRTLIGVEYKHFWDTKVSEGSAYLEVYPAENKFLHIGGTDIIVPPTSRNHTKKNQTGLDKTQSVFGLDAQLGYKFFDNRLTVRGGLMEGKAGVGLDYDFPFPGTRHDIRFTVEGRAPWNDVGHDNYDENADAIFNAEISTRLFKYFRLEVGMSRFTENPDFYSGIVFEWEDDDIRKFIGLISNVK